MGLGSWIKDKYNRVDSALGGHLPGGVAPGQPYIPMGSPYTSVPQGTYSPGGYTPAGATPGGVNPLQAGPGAPGATPGAGGSGLMGWLQQHPELAAALVGGGASVYGAYKQGQSEDKQAQLQQDQFDYDKQRQDRMDALRAEQRARLLAGT